MIRKGGPRPRQAAVVPIGKLNRQDRGQRTGDAAQIAVDFGRTVPLRKIVILRRTRCAGSRGLVLASVAAKG